MIQQISGLAADVAAFRVTGEVTKDDYDAVILPAVKSVVAKSDHLNFLLILDTDLTKYTIGAWADDAWVTLKNLTKFKRVALVSDSEKVKWITKLGAKFIPGDYRTFSLKDQQAAINWVNSGVA